VVNAAVAFLGLSFLTSVALVAAGAGSRAAAFPGRTHPTASVTTSPSTPPPSTSPPATTAPPPSTAPPPTAPPTTRTTPTVTSPVTTVPGRKPRGARPGSVLPLAPAPTAPTTSTTSTTIGAIGGRLPPAPVTLPLTTKGSNAHVNPLYAWLSGIGFFVALVVMAGRFVTSRPKRRRAGVEGGA
jgi:hypothetical protein